MARMPWMLVILSLLVSLASAASAPTFCKCSCFTNSTIIPLDAKFPSAVKPGSADPSHAAVHLAARAGAGSCSRCNRAFCLENNLPICKGAEEKDVMAMCFQRDSRKDQIMVWAFLLATTGLLGWAGAQRVLKMRASVGTPETNNSSNRGVGGQNHSGLGEALRSPRSPSLGGGSRGQYAPVVGSGD